MTSRSAPRSRTLLAALGVLAAATAAAEANDSTAALDAGGLVLKASNDLVMESEDLFISPSEVRVTYVFRNIKGSDVETIVAFPLPDIDMPSLFGSALAGRARDPLNFLEFQVEVDGAPVQPLAEQKAFLGGQDVTADLRRLGLPLSIFEADAAERLVAAPEPALREAVRLGLLEWEGSPGEQPLPNWTLRTTHYWTQRFPAGRPVVVRHVYEPVAGLSQFHEAELEDEISSTPDARVAAFCIDPATQAAIRKKMRSIEPLPGQGTLIATEVGYVLSTGANWAGPIRRFRLTIDKGAPDAIVSLCFDGVKRTGPTTFVFERTDFTPQGDLRLLILTAPAGSGTEQAPNSPDLSNGSPPRPGVPADPSPAASGGVLR